MSSWKSHLGNQSPRLQTLCNLETLNATSWVPGCESFLSHLLHWVLEPKAESARVFHLSFIAFSWEEMHQIQLFWISILCLGVCMCVCIHARIFTLSCIAFETSVSKIYIFKKPSISTLHCKFRPVCADTGIKSFISHLNSFITELFYKMATLWPLPLGPCKWSTFPISSLHCGWNRQISDVIRRITTSSMSCSSVYSQKCLSSWGSVDPVSVYQSIENFNVYI